MTSPRLYIAHALREIVSVPRTRATDRLRVADFTLRSVGKAALDFSLAVFAVMNAVVLHDGFTAILKPRNLALAAGAGLLLVLVHGAQGSYRTIWRYTSLREATAIARSSAVLLAALLVAHAVGIVGHTAPVLVLAALLTTFFGVGARVLRRLQMADASDRRGGAAVPVRKRVLIAGAGDHGLSIGRDILTTPSAGVELVGFVDDDPAKIGASIGGRRVLGPLSQALALAEQHDVSEIIVAMPGTDARIVKKFVRGIEDAGLRVRALSGIDGRPMHRPGSTTADDLIAVSLGKPRIRTENTGRRRVLVTGGAGFIGSHLTRLLLDRGYHVRVLDRFDYGRSGIDSIKHPRLEVMQGDICSSRDVSRAVRDVDGVLALAAIVGDPACNLDPEETINLNYTSTRILVDACNLYGVKRLVFASSCSVYGASESGLLTERSRLNPVSLYARTRVLSENIIFDNCGDVEPVVLRLATVFGLSPRMRFDLVVNTLTVRAVVDGRIAVFGGDQWRPNVHCRDVARAFTMALEAPAEKVAGEIFNVGGNGQNHTIADLGSLVAQTVGNVEVEYPAEVTDARNYRVDFSKIRTVLGFEPDYTVAMGIEEVAWAVRNNVHLQNYQNPIYSNVQALKQTLAAPRRRREDFAPLTPPVVADGPSAIAV